MKKLLLLSIMISLALPALAVDHLRLATTTSTENSGLLAAIIPPFERDADCRVDVIAVGTGKAIKLAENGDVDVILVHARSREDEFIREGYGIDRRDVMYNDFVLIGPENDPAGISNAGNSAEAITRIASARAPFISRADDSGTHSKEKALWRAASLKPSGAWYLATGRGMGEVIIMAEELQGYTLSDRGTYLAFKDKINLAILFEGDGKLHNPYGAIMVNPARHQHVQADLAKRFLDYLNSDQARELISNFRRGGEQLFYVK